MFTLSFTFTICCIKYKKKMTRDFGYLPGSSFFTHVISEWRTQPILRWPGEACHLWRWLSPGALLPKLGVQGASFGAVSGAQLRSNLQRFQVSCSSAQFSCALRVGQLFTDTWQNNNNITQPKP